MGRAVIDLKGQQFGRWTVLEQVGRVRDAGNVIWRCQCECGKYASIASSDLRRGKTHGCGKCGAKHRRKEMK